MAMEDNGAAAHHGAHVRQSRGNQVNGTTFGNGRSIDILWEFQVPGLHMEARAIYWRIQTADDPVQRDANR